MSYIQNRVTSVVPIGGVATLTGNSGGSVGPTGGTINVVGGTDITVVGNPGTSTLTISATGAAVFTWSVITANQTAAVQNGYIANKASTLVLLLPATAAIGNIIRVTGINTATGWQITQNAGQQIFFGATSTTSGTGGSLASTAIRDSVELVCVVAGASTVWNVISSVGNITVT